MSSEMTAEGRAGFWSHRRDDVAGPLFHQLSGTQEYGPAFRGRGLRPGFERRGRGGDRPGRVGGSRSGNGRNGIAGVRVDVLVGLACRRFLLLAGDE
jgi:hypothetical protein